MPTYLYIFIKISGILKSTYKPILFLKIIARQGCTHLLAQHLGSKCSRSLRVSGKHGLCIEFQTRQSYMVRFCLKK